VNGKPILNYKNKYTKYYAATGYNDFELSAYNDLS